MTTSTIRPFTIRVPQGDLDDLQQRLARTRFTQEIPDQGAKYGVTLAYVTRLLDRWRSGYDWRAWEAKLNAHPQFTTQIDGQTIHFIHVRSPNAAALPLIMTHGWPGSIVEFLDVIEPLTADFHLVIPSMPGFGFSGPTTEPGWNRYRTAKAWAELMRRLGYDRYGAVGNDGGSMVSPELGRIDPEHVVAVHVTQIFSFPSGDPAEFNGLTPDEMKGLEVLQWFNENMMGFNYLQSTQPQNLAHAIADSPAGQLAWSGQLFFEGQVSDDFILTNVTIYWLTNTGASSARFYYEDRHAQHPVGPTTAPLGLCAFAGDFKSMRRFAERDHAHIVQWHEYDLEAGHYAAHRAPAMYARDVREFFTAVRLPARSP